MCSNEEVCDLSTEHANSLNNKKEVSLNRHICLLYRFVDNTLPNFSTMATGASVLHLKRGNYRQKEEMTR